ncbi:MAG TPA: FtsX-like permease family protein [Thermoleophilia bacterium]|nr:FtsX-like permease family protein [Thermoleophilia bacterium]
MVRIAWRSLTAHKLRTFLTTLAILLGVAMISGTYVLTDQIDRGFKQVFTDAYKGTDVTVTRQARFSGQLTGATEGLPEDMVRQVEAVDGVGEVFGYVSGMGAVAVDGEVVETGGSPTLFFSYSPNDIAPPQYTEGRPPEQPGEVAVIEKLAQDKKLSPGSPITVITDGGGHEATVSGVFRFAAQSSLGGSILIHTTLSDAQQWFDMQGRVSEIDVKAEAGVSADELARRIRAALPEYTEVKTGAQAAADQTKALSDAIGAFLRPVLLSFGGIAVLVGAFIIFNAFSMTVAQRRREFAMLRALGASRAQVLWSITGEAFVMGVLASVLGLFAGLGVAAGVNYVFQAAGFDIPRSGLVMQPRTVVIALVVGIVVTVLSAVIPAQRATRVPPMAALQEGAVLPPSRFARFMPALAVVVAILGGLLIGGGMYGPGGTVVRLGTIAFGAVLVFLAVAIASRYFVGPLAAWLGWPLQKLAPISGRLARDNSRRNPSRTALTAAALMIGLAVVVFVAVLAQGLKSSFIDSYDRTVRADFVIASSNFMTIPTDTATRVQSVQGVETAVSLDAQQVQAENGSLPVVWGIDPVAIERVWSFDWISGGDDVLTELRLDGAIVEEQTASSLGVERGGTIEVTTVEGEQATLRVLGVYRDPMMLNGIAVGTSGYNALFPKPQTFMVVAKAQPGADIAATQKEIETALASAPTAEVQTTEQYKEGTVDLVNQLLLLIYGLLALSVIISLFGIVNTLVLAVYERTREIGLVRAIGMSRGQVRATVRYESVITSIIGAIMGIVVGIVFAWVVTTRFAGQGITFSVPGVQLAVFLVLAVVVGVIAAILPARRAARIDILQAIHYE